MNVIITSIAALGFLDLYYTLRWITIDANLEANPIFRWLWTYNPQLFIWVKILLTITFCIIFYQTKKEKLCQRLIWMPLAAYTFVLFLHIKVCSIL